ncbi:hypothetical protein [Spiroplasma diminutum]|uniref:Uncharacterized protein n=1 Tax=Spiroplasma diminutum CUAS-1 TaxID=1276221 RepID=S5MF58_9MOLU|nr:hypothetical protein [Spiroplasma diminutum]AGR42428.1 hypothetical protein SDIMI_v3c07240 [Spiroplasma diminutum CUAS-1]
MNLINRKKSRNKKIQESQEKHEDRAPNHWTYNDDPLLNMEPVFTDHPDANKISIEDISKQYATGPLNEENTSVTDRIAEIRRNLGKTESSNNTGGVLGSIINGARMKSQSIQNEIIENDPVIAKLQKIEELRKNGGVHDDVYTDVEKIKSNSISYYERAREFHEKNSSKPLESKLERARRLSQEIQNQRDERKKESKSHLENKSLIDETQQDLSIFMAVGKSQIRQNSIEEKVKDKLFKLKEIKLRNLEEEIEQTIQEFDSKKFLNEEIKEEFFEEKLKEFDELLKESTKPDRKPELIKPRRLQDKKE